MLITTKIFTFVSPPIPLDVVVPVPVGVGKENSKEDRDLFRFRRKSFKFYDENLLFFRNKVSN